jgi:hypothetical protein
MSPFYNATALLAHLLLLNTKSNPHAKAKEPNSHTHFFGLN